TGVLSGTPSNTDVGVPLNITITASDGSLSVPQTFSLNVLNANDAPVASLIPAQVATESQVFNFSAAGFFSDADIGQGDVLTYTATLADGSPLPAWLTFNASTGTFSGTPALADLANLSVKVRATDQTTAFAEQTFALTVRDDTIVLGANAAGSALRLDGGDFATAAPSTLAGTGDFTIEAWVNPTDLTGTRPIVAKGDFAATENLKLSLVNGQLTFDATDGTHSVALNAASALTAGTWAHVAVVRTGDYYELFVNGLGVANSTASGPIAVSAIDPLSVGARLFDDGTAMADGFIGQIDGIRLWSDARTATEISSDYRLKTPATTDNLVANWTMEAVSGGQVADVSGNSLPLTLGQTTITEASDPTVINPPGTAMVFNGGTTYVQVTPDLATGTGVTYEAWIKTGQTTGRYDVISSGNPDVADAAAYLYVNNGKLGFNISSTTGPQSTATVADGQWHHVAAVIDDAGSVTLYVDGITDGSMAIGTYSIGSGRTLIGAGSLPAASIGNYFSGEIADARIWDSVRTPADIAANMNIRLTGDEYGLAGNFSLGETVVQGGVTIAPNQADDSWAAGEVYGAPTVTGTKPGAYTDAITVREDTAYSSKILAVDLNGHMQNVSIASGGYPSHGWLELQSDGTFTYTPSHDYVGSDSFTVDIFDSGTSTTVSKTISVTVAAVDDPADLSAPPAHEHGSLGLHGHAAVEIAGGLPTGTQSVTYEMWFQTGVTTGTMSLLSAGGTTVNSGIDLRMSAGQLQLAVSGGSTVATTGPSLADGDWHHVAAVVENLGTGSSRLSLFVDGKWSNSVDFAGIVDIQTATASLGRGLSTTPGTEQYYSGDLSDVRVHTGARSMDQIRTDMQAPASPSDPSLVAWYDFSTGTGTVNVADATTAGLHDGTIVNGDYHWSDRISAVTEAGTALALDGATIYDPDASANLPASIKLVVMADHGTVTLASTTGLTFVDSTTNGGAHLAFTGTPAAITAAMASVTYTPAAGFAGRDTLHIMVDELHATLTRANSYDMPILVLPTPTAGADVLSGSGSGDVIDGLAGDDTLTGLGGNDTLLGGDGNDTLDGGDGMDLVVGGLGADSLAGGTGSDIFAYTGLGQSTTGATDTITDFGIGAISDAIRFDGMAGIAYDATSYTFTTDAATTVTNIVNDGAVANKLVYFTDGIHGYLYVKGAGTGTSFDGTFITLANRTAPPTLAEIHNGFLYGTNAMDTLTGGAGAETIIGMDGADTLTGGAGGDTFRYTSSTNSTTAMMDVITDFTVGSDRIVFEGMAGMAYYADPYPVLGATVTDTVNALSSAAMIMNRVVFFAQGGDGYLYVKGMGGGTDYNGTLIKLAGVTTAPAATDIGGVTAALGHVVQGGTGDDTISGGGGADTLYGEMGNDSLAGGGGDDMIRGGMGGDTLTGGLGGDDFAYMGGDSSTAAPDTITDFTVADGDAVVLSGIGGILYSGTAHAFTTDVATTVTNIVNTATNNQLVYFTDGSDGWLYVKGMGWGTTFDGTLIRLAGVTTAPPITALPGLLTHAGDNAQPDTITGTTGADIIGTGGMNDSIDGNLGDDTLIGGMGADTLTGGMGADTFAYTMGTDSDSASFDTL
ncbi:MAG: LamG-like jellyroll fold domain-containing protein, partial [Pseudomonadota bacterium]